MGIDDQSQGIRVYWPDSKTVTVERNIYMDKLGSSVNRLEGENFDFEIETTDCGTPSGTPPATVPPDPMPGTPVPVPSQPSVPHFEPEIPEPAPKRTRKVTQKLQDLMDGKGTYSNRRSDPVMPRGIVIPKVGDGGSDGEVEGEGDPDELLMIEEGNFVEYGLVAETSEVEGLDPASLAEAKRRPDWPFWEKAMEEELATLEAAGTWELVDHPGEGHNIVGSKWVF